MAKIKQIALALQPSIGFYRDVQSGVGQYAQTHGGWVFHVSIGEVFRQVDDIGKWKGDGIIAVVSNRKMQRMLARKRIPVVNICSRLADSRLPSVICDNVNIGAVAARHFLERGFKNIACFSYPRNFWHSQQRWEGFEKTAKAGGVSAALIRIPEWDPPTLEPIVLEWIRSLNYPIGIFAVNDRLARFLTEICWQNNIAVPEKVAVLGVDNDKSTLEICNPPLSSIDPDGVRIGYATAALLDRLMAGEPAPDQPILVRPRGVVCRRSTDILAIEDDVVAEAIRIIHQHRDEPFTVNEVVRKLAISRRAFERRFKACMGRTPWQQIRHVQIQHVKRLLCETDLPIAGIAKRSAFSDPGRMCNVFHSETGQAPSVFRKQYRIEY